MKLNGPVPFALVLWELCEHFHWTLDEAESLSMEKLAEWEQIKDGRAHAEKSLLK